MIRYFLPAAVISASFVSCHVVQTDEEFHNQTMVEKYHTPNAAYAEFHQGLSDSENDYKSGKSYCLTNRQKNLKFKGETYNAYAEGYNRGYDIAKKMANVDKEASKYAQQSQANKNK